MQSDIEEVKSNPVEMFLWKKKGKKKGNKKQNKNKGNFNTISENNSMLQIYFWAIYTYEVY